MKHTKWIAFSLLALSVFASAQTSSNVSVFATGFNNPRGLKWGPDGNLYVAEAGSGGTNTTVGQCQQVPVPLGPWGGGWNARISKVTPGGTRSTLVGGLPSAAAGVGDEARQAHARAAKLYERKGNVVSAEQAHALANGSTVRA